MNRDTEAVGQDSFLDVVANIVGILIILVMVAGMRMANASVEAPPAPELEKAKRKLQESIATEAALRDETLDLAERIKSTAVGAEEQQALRDALARNIVEWERRIAERKQTLDSRRARHSISTRIWRMRSGCWRSWRVKRRNWPRRRRRRRSSRAIALR